MKPRFLLSVILVAVALVALGKVLAQHNQLAELRAENRQLLARAVAPPETLARPAPRPSILAAPVGAGTTVTESPELLRLRSEVTRLMGRQRELSGVRLENERLRAQLAARGTNAPAGATLPPGYLLRTQAKWAGTDSPENAMQSLLWAMQSRNLTNIVSVMTPENGGQILEQYQRSGKTLEAFLEDMAHIPGMRVLGREVRPDGTIVLQVEFVPGEPPTPMVFRQVNGQWRLASG